MRDRLAFSVMLIALLLVLPAIPSLIDLAGRVHFHPHSSTDEDSRDNSVLENGADDVTPPPGSSSPEVRDMVLEADKREEERRQKQLADQKKRDEEKKKRDEELRQKQLAEQERKRLMEELERDLAEIEAAAENNRAKLDQSRDPNSVSNEIEIERIKSEIRNKVRRNWAWSGDNTKLEVKYRINLSVNGDILDLQKIGASGDSSFDVSVSQAIRLAKPLPVPKDELLFRENFDPLIIRFTLDELFR